MSSRSIFPAKLVPDARPSCGALSLWAVGILAAGCALTTSAAEAQDAQLPEALVARMAAEKEARRACKIEICTAFANPDVNGAPISCDVTKTWLKTEITARVVGGSWVWGYGHVQCSMTLDLARSEIARAMTQDRAEISFPEHKLSCNVDDTDPTKGEAFRMNISLTPAATFEKAQATAVTLEPVKTEGSNIASAAVGALMAADKVAGFVSRAAAAEINSFLFSKCGEDGVQVSKRE